MRVGGEGEGLVSGLVSGLGLRVGAGAPQPLGCMRWGGGERATWKSARHGACPWESGQCNGSVTVM